MILFEKRMGLVVGFRPLGYVYDLMRKEWNWLVG